MYVIEVFGDSKCGTVTELRNNSLMLCFFDLFKVGKSEAGCHIIYSYVFPDFTKL